LFLLDYATTTYEAALVENPSLEPATFNRETIDSYSRKHYTKNSLNIWIDSGWKDFAGVKSFGAFKSVFC
jgi:hypothetical protein